MTGICTVPEGLPLYTLDTIEALFRVAYEKEATIAFDHEEGDVVVSIPDEDASFIMRTVMTASVVALVFAETGSIEGVSVIVSNSDARMVDNYLQNS